MKTLLLSVLALLLVATAIPQEANAQSVWERAREAAERQRAEQRDDDRQVERERDARRQAEERERQTRTTQPQRRAEEQRREETQRRAEQQRRTDAQRRSQPRQRGGQAGGPAFCRSGAGHPVFGMQWCYDKGFATGRDVIWQRRSIGDVIIGRDTRRSGTMSGSILDRVLGRDVTHRAVEQGRRAGFSGDLVGTWLDSSMLELTLGGTPVMRLVDETGDGRIDYALVAQY